MASDGRGWTFTHDDRLTRAVNSGTGVTMAYAYAHANLRIESVRNPTGTKPDGTPAGGTRFLLSGDEAAWRAATGPRRARQADIEVSATGVRTVTRRYVPGAAIDERLADINAQTGVVHFLHTDRQNSVVAILLQPSTSDNPWMNFITCSNVRGMLERQTHRVYR